MAIDKQAVFVKRLISAMNTWNAIPYSDHGAAIARADAVFDETMTTGTLSGFLLRMRDELIRTEER